MAGERLTDLPCFAGTESAWRAEVPSPTGVPEIVVSPFAEDTACESSPLLALACWTSVALNLDPALATAAAAEDDALHPPNFPVLSK